VTTPRRHVWSILLSGLMALPAGCVTETTVPSRGLQVRPKGSGASKPAGTGGPTEKAELPDGPVARPATAVSNSAAVRVAFVPLGTVQYDGQCLPIISPDGRFLAVQSGEAPSWPTILAEKGAEPAFRTTLSVYDITGTQARLLPNSQSLPGGLLLGRSADNQGFLVESPQRSGARWIGKIAWLTGEVTWLAADESVNAHAVLTPSGGVLYARRPQAESVSELVLHEPGAEPSVLASPDGSYAHPFATDEPGVVYAVLITPRGSDLQAIRVRNAKLQSVMLQRSLSPSTDPLLAHQMSVTAAAPLLQGTLRIDPTPLVVLSPRHGRMAVFDNASGVFEPLAPKSVAAAPSPDPSSPGYFCTTPEGLAFVAKIGVGGATGLPVTMISTPYVPRTIATGPPRLLLVGPVKGAPDRLEVVRMNLAPPADTSQK